MKLHIKILFYLAILFSPSTVLAQQSKIVIQDKLDHRPLIGISMLSESGSLIASSNANGEIIFDLSSFAALGNDKVLFYNTDYQTVEMSIISLPTMVYLDKLNSHSLEAVEINAKHVSKYFTLKAYVRSWKLVNDKLVRYGDAIVDYQVPFKRKKGFFHLENEKYIKAFRNFRIDDVKAKSRIVSVSAFDGYFADHLPNGDRLSSSWSWYTTKKNQDSLHTVYDDGKSVGYAIFDRNNLPVEINVGSSFEGDEAIKIALWWKIAGKSKNIEKWRGTGETRRPTYIFSNRKTLVKSKVKNEHNTEETVTEIFIDDQIQYNAGIPEKYKKAVNIDQSFYSSDYWTEEIKRRPLSGFIQTQLNNVKELKNTY